MADREIIRLPSKKTVTFKIIRLLRENLKYTAV